MSAMRCWVLLFGVVAVFKLFMLVLFWRHRHRVRAREREREVLTCHRMIKIESEKDEESFSGSYTIGAYSFSQLSSYHQALSMSHCIRNVEGYLFSFCKLTLQSSIW